VRVTSVARQDLLPLASETRGEFLGDPRGVPTGEFLKDTAGETRGVLAGDSAIVFSFILRTGELECLGPLRCAELSASRPLLHCWRGGGANASGSAPLSLGTFRVRAASLRGVKSLAPALVASPPSLLLLLLLLQLLLLLLLLWHSASEMKKTLSLSFDLDSALTLDSVLAFNSILA